MDTGSVHEVIYVEYPHDVVPLQLFFVPVHDSPGKSHMCLAAHIAEKGRFGHAYSLGIYPTPKPDTENPNPSKREICEEYVKFKGLDMTGREFWESDPNGWLTHVFNARLEMYLAGHPIPKLPKN